MPTFGLFKARITPFVTSDLSRPFEVSLAAMVDDGTANPNYRGKAALKIQGENQSFLLTKLYDSGMNPLFGFTTGEFVDGGWQGFLLVSRADTVNNSFAVEVNSVGATMNGEPINTQGSSVAITVNDAPPPPVRTISVSRTIFTDDTLQENVATSEKGIRRVRVVFSDGTKTDIT